MRIAYFNNHVYVIVYNTDIQCSLKTIWCAIRCARPPGADGFSPWFTRNWGIRTWHSMTCGKKKRSLIVRLIEVTACPFQPPIHATFFSSFSLDACPGVLWWITPDIYTVMSGDGEIMKKGADLEIWIFHKMVFRHVVHRWDVFLRKRASWWSDFDFRQEKHCVYRVCTSVCVFVFF